MYERRMNGKIWRRIQVRDLNSVTISISTRWNQDGSYSTRVKHKLNGPGENKSHEHIMCRNDNGRKSNHLPYPFPFAD